MDIRLTEEQKKQQGLIREVISDFEKSLRGSSNSVSLNNLAKELKDLGLIVDKNQDGNVDKQEIRTLVKELKKISTSANVVKLFTKDGQINPSSKVLTDITGDNIVNSQDIQALQNLLKGKEDAAGKPPVLSTQAVGIDAHQSMIEHYNSQLTLERNKPEPDIGKINSLTVSIITHQSAITTLQDS
jgi:hypothetical protein